MAILNNKLKILLMGNKDLAVRCLNYLLDSSENVVGIILNHDDSGASGTWFKSLKREAIKRKIKYWQPKTCNSPDFLDEIRKIKPDIIFSFSYNRIIKQDFIDIPKIGIYNFHFAKLPKNRGCLPVVYSLAYNDIIGVTLHKIDVGIDTGEIIDQKIIHIQNTDTAYSLYFKCVSLAENIFRNNLAAIKSGKIKLHKQDESLATYHKQVYPEDRWIDWRKTPAEIDRFVRALTFESYPSARTIYKNQEIEILYPIKIKSFKNANLGEVISIKNGLEIGCSQGSIVAYKFRIDSRKLSAKQLIQRLKIKVGDKFLQKPLKILHIGNIANNAYINSKFLREEGLQSDVICYDYYHIMSTPEWEDAKLTGNYGHDFAPDWGKVDLHGFKRPSWFMQGTLEQIALHKFGWKHRKEKDPSLFFIKPVDYLINWRTSLNKFILKNDILTKNKFLNIFTQGIFGTIAVLIRYLFWAEKQLVLEGEKDAFTQKDFTYWQSLIDEFVLMFPDRKDKLKFSDIRFFLYRTEIFKHIFKNYDLVQCYATDPIYALLANKRPYIAFEHGTIRDLPFENSGVGRLTALAYRKADHVFISNSDNIFAAKKLGLKNYTAIPHPIDDYWLNSEQTKTNDIYLFCPSRHDFQVKGTDIYINSFAEVVKKFPKTKLVMVEWGQDLVKSKTLIKELNLQNRIVWLKPLPKYLLISWIRKSVIVLDQMHINAMGAITPEAMQAGRPVVMSYRHEICKWQFPDPPPIVTAYNQKEVTKAILKLLANPKLLHSIGLQSNKWFEKYHSKSVVKVKLKTEYDKVLNEKL